MNIWLLSTSWLELYLCVKSYASELNKTANKGLSMAGMTIDTL